MYVCTSVTRTFRTEVLVTDARKVELVPNLRCRMNNTSMRARNVRGYGTYNRGVSRSDIRRASQQLGIGLGQKPPSAPTPPLNGSASDKALHEQSILAANVKHTLPMFDGGAH